MTDINEIVGEQIENLSKGVEAERREIEDYKASGNAELIIAARVMQQHFDRKTKNLNAWLAIQDVLAIIDKKPVPHVQRIEYQMRMKPLNDFKNELRQAITNRLGGEE